MGPVGGVGSRERASGRLLGRWSRRRLIVGAWVVSAFEGVEREKEEEEEDV